MSERAQREEFYAWVYENNHWGRSPDGARYYSDSPAEATRPYREYVGTFIRAHPDIRRVVDLACGDFKVTRETDLGPTSYTGVDIYDKLIADNRSRYGDARHEFLVRDLIEDELPPGDLCLISMTLYLMSHADVLAVLPKLRRYRYVLVTDAQPDGPAAERRNVDSPAARDTPRDLYRIGFYLELEPFNLELEVVHQYRVPSGKIIRTVLIEHPVRPADASRPIVTWPGSRARPAHPRPPLPVPGSVTGT